MENGPFIDGLPMNSMVGFSMAMLVITRWYTVYIYIYLLFKTKATWDTDPQ